MILQGDPRVTEFYVQALIEHECQFVLIHKNGKKVRIAFHKGTWKVMRENGVWFELNDSPDIVYCEDSLLRGFLEEMFKKHEGKHRNWFRTDPAMMILDTLRIWLGNVEDISEINVMQAGRDGWFTNFND